MNSPNVQRVLRASLIVLAIGFTLYFFYASFKYTYPFVIGYIFAMFMNPMVNYFMNKLKMPRILAVILSMLISIAVLTIILIVIIIQIISGAKYLLDILPGFVQEFSHNLAVFFETTILPQFEKISTFYESFGTAQQASMTDSINSLVRDLANLVMSFLKAFIGSLPGLITWLPNVTIGLLFILLATFFISQQWDKLFDFMKETISDRVFSPMVNILRIVKKAVVGFLRAQVVLFFVSGITASIAFSIVGIDHPITMGIIVGIGETIPYIGVVAVFVPWIIFAFITGEIGTAISLIVIFAIIAIQRIIVEPKILSKNMDLNPLATLFAMFVGLKLMGVIGVLLGTVVLVVLTTLYRNGVFGKVRDYIMK